MENGAWYKEKWATDIMGIIAKEVFKKPAEPPVVSPQQPPSLGAEPGNWTVPVVVVSVIALILLLFFLKKGKR